jgi:hypothetical protein
MPVYPYDARGTTFHGWTVDVSFRDSMSVELDLQPQTPRDGPIAVNVDLKRLRGRWLIDSFYPRTSYAPPSASTRPTGETSRRAAPAAAPTDEPKHTSLMWALLAAILGLVVLTPLTIAGGMTLRNRRASRRSASQLRS